MRRRRLLAVRAAGATAGCASEDDTTTTGGSDPVRSRTGADASTRTATASATPESGGTAESFETVVPISTPTPDPPEVLAVDLVDEWEEPGDLATEGQESVRPGALVAGAARFTVPTHYGRFEARADVRILRDGELVAEGSARVDGETDAERVEREVGVGLSTPSWEERTHTLEVVVTDTVSGRSSAPATTTFRVQPVSGSG